MRILRRNVGFTLVELLVVIAIIGVLVSLLLPAVQSARESARRAVCASNIRQAGLAVLELEAARNKLPSGAWIADPAPTVTCGIDRDYAWNSVERGCFDIYGFRAPAVSWIVTVLPYLEEQSLYDQFDFTVPLASWAKGNAKPPYATQIASLVCPSSGARTAPNYQGEDLPASVTHANVQTFGFAKTSVAAYTSPSHVNHYQSRPGALGGFRRGRQLGQKLRHVTDGLSKTALAAEVRSLDREWDSRGVWAAPFPGGSLIGVNFHDVDENFTTPVYVPNPRGIGNVRLPNTQDPAGDGLIVCKEAAYTRAQRMPCRTKGSVYGVPRSLHPGGVNLVLLDGAVKFLADDVDPYVYAYLVSSNDQRVVDTSKYLQ